MSSCCKVITKSIIFLLLCLPLVSCVQATSMTEETVIRTQIIYPTITGTELISTKQSTHLPPTIVNTDIPSTKTPFPVIPDLLTLAISEYPILTSHSSSCELPCWYGLQLGISKLSDVQDVYDDIFDINNILDLSHILFEGMPNHMDDFPGIYYATLLWEFNPGAFIIDVVFDSSETLQGISLWFWESPEDQFISASTKELIEQIGQPDYIYVDISQVGMERTGETDIYLIYKHGITLFLEYKIEPSILNDKYIYQSLCFSETPYLTAIQLVPSFDDLNSQNITIPQKIWIFDQISSGRWLSTQRAFGMTLEEFVQFILQPEPCLEIDYSAYE